MTSSSIMIDLDDPRTRKIADVMANATCKKIIGLLAERELSESELAKSLGIPLTTINYNMKKLMGAGLVELVRSLWSTKGRAVKVYRVSQKKIVISPRTLSRGSLPALIASVIGSLGIYLWETRTTISDVAVSASREALAYAAKEADASLPGATVISASFGLPLWLWFFIGAVFAIATLSFWNWLRT